MGGKLEIVGWQMLLWAWVYSSCYIMTETTLFAAKNWYGFPNALVAVVGFFCILLATVYRIVSILSD